MTLTDRRVHARTGVVEVVRYDRAGKWFLEWPNGSLIPCQAVSFKQAVGWGRAALTDGEVFFGLPGGSRFDREVRPDV